MNQEKNKRMCLKCYGVVTSGIVHLYGKVQTVKNLVDLAYGLGSASAEGVASSILKYMKQENIFRGEKFTIATHGKPLTIVAGTQDKKSDRDSLNQISFGTIMELIKCFFLKEILTLSKIVRVAVDSGQGFLKVTMNAFNPSDKTSNQPDLGHAGVNRYFVVAIAEGVSEHNGNLRKLLDPLDLQNINYSITWYFKSWWKI